MAPSLSWIDTSELEHALSRAEGRKKVVAPAPPPNEWTRPSAMTREMDALAAQRSAEPTFEGPISNRARGFCEWARTGVGCEAVCIADSDGLLIHNSGAGEGDAAASALLASALRRIAPLIGGAAMSAAIENESGRWAHVIWSATRVGTVAGVLVTPAPLDPGRLRAVRAALVRVFQ